MALFVLLGLSVGFKELCLGLVMLFQCLFLFCWVLGPSCPLCWSGFFVLVLRFRVLPFWVL